MTIQTALIWGTNILNKTAKYRASHSDSPILDSEILLCAAISKTKEYIFAHPEKKLTARQISKYKKMIARRVKHEPVAYILGKKDFFGFEFLVHPFKSPALRGSRSEFNRVNKNVLIPRPDTETLVDAALSFLRKQESSGNTIIDIGTGSGAIAITLKKLFPKARVFASDISSSALALAKKNAKRLHAKVIFKKSDLLQNVQYPILHMKKLFITANLPYLSRKEWQKCQPEIKKYEPYGALVAGKTGTEIYEKLFKELFAAFACNSRHSHRVYLFIEIGHNQKSAIAKLAKKIIKPKKIDFIKDLAGKWRVAKIQI